MPYIRYNIISHNYSTGQQFFHKKISLFNTKRNIYELWYYNNIIMCAHIIQLPAITHQHNHYMTLLLWSVDLRIALQ